MRTGFVFIVCGLSLVSAVSPTHNGVEQATDILMDERQFHDLMNRLAVAWSEQDTEAGLSSFTEDAIYIEPPDIQFFQGHEQLREYFGALKPGTLMKFHNVLFNATQQIGAGEYSFQMGGSENAVHGVAIVSLQNGRVTFWREYQRKGPAFFDQFLAIEGKQWQWHIGNYPPREQ